MERTIRTSCALTIQRMTWFVRRSPRSWTSIDGRTRDPEKQPLNRSNRLSVKSLGSHLFLNNNTIKVTIMRFLSTITHWDRGAAVMNPLLLDLSSSSQMRLMQHLTCSIISSSNIINRSISIWMSKISSRIWLLMT
jgi:hypothetical protein